MTASTYPAVSRWESIGLVRAMSSKRRDEVKEFAQRLADECHDGGMHRGSQRDAASCALLLEDAPYVSVALKAHAHCMAAMSHQLSEYGFVDISLNDLAFALSDLISDSGLRLKEMRWRISAGSRASATRRTFAAGLAWDADDLELEVTE